MNNTPSLQSLIYRAKSTLKNASGVDNPAINALACAVGGVAFGQYGYADYLFKQLHPETCNEEWLYLHATRLNVARISHFYASGLVSFERVGGVVVVPQNAIVRTSDNKEYLVTMATNSNLPVPVKAALPNTQGNLPAGERLFLVSAITGLHPDEIISHSISGGADLEEIEHWRNRVILANQVRNAVGTTQDYEFWAISSHQNIDYAWTLDNTPEVGHVTVYIGHRDNDPLLVEPIRATAQRYIDAHRLAGCHVFVTLPTLKSVTITLSGVPDINVRHHIETALAVFFTDRLANRNSLFSHEISTVISGITSQFNVVLPTAETTLLESELLTFGGVTWR